MGHSQYGHPFRKQLHELRKQKGCRRRNAKEALETRPTAMDAEDNGRCLPENKDMDTPTSVSGKRELPPLDAAEPSGGSTLCRNRRHRADAVRTALVADMEVVKENALW